MSRLLLQQALRHPILTAHCLKGAVAALMCTCRSEVHGLGHLLSSAATGPCLLLLWHDRLVPIADMLRRQAPALKYHAVVSDSRDGRLLASYTKTFPQADVIPIAHWARSSAVKAMRQPLRHPGDIVVATPDGPRGPRRTVKKGVVKLAQVSQAPIIPLHWEASRCWHLRKSWDRMAIPQPFSRLVFRFGTPFVVPADYSLGEGGLLLADALNGVHVC